MWKGWFPPCRYSLPDWPRCLHYRASNVKALTCCRMTFPASPFRARWSTLTFCARQALKAVMPSQQSPKMITPTLWFARLPEKYSMFQNHRANFDPLREDIFSRFDIQSVCPTNITVSSVYAMLTDRTQTKHITVGNEVMSVSTMKAPHELIGKSVAEAASLSPAGIADCCHWWNRRNYHGSGYSAQSNPSPHHLGTWQTACQHRYPLTECGERNCYERYCNWRRKSRVLSLQNPFWNMVTNLWSLKRTSTPANMPPISWTFPTINADGSTIEALKTANAPKADALIAVTGLDQDNLISCQLAKKIFHVPKTVARVNNPKMPLLSETAGRRHPDFQYRQHCASAGTWGRQCAHQVPALLKSVVRLP